MKQSPPRICRRTFLKTGAGLALSAFPTMQGCPSFPDALGPELPIANVISSRNGVLDAVLRVQFAALTLGDRTINTRSYNGTLPGPLLRVRPGDVLRISLLNGLPDNTDGEPFDINVPHNPNTTNLHTHGLHVAPSGNSDNALIDVEPGTDFDYEIVLPASHPPGTFWYHPHRHGSVSTQMFGGMAGAIIVEGGADDVPEIAAAQERVMLFQEIRVNDDGEVISVGPNLFGTENQHMFSGGTVFRTVNGATNPVITMAPGEVQRWRLINGNVTEYMNLAITGHDMHLIAWDGITLEVPLILPNLELSPGNRADVLIKARGAGAYQITSTGGHGFGGMMMNPMGTGNGFGARVTLANLLVEGAAADMALPGMLPVPLALPTITTQEIVGNREITLSVGMNDISFPRFLIDGLPFDPTRIDHAVFLGDAEEWTIRNLSMMDHPMHFHTNFIQVTGINGRTLQTPRWADTVSVPANGSVTIRMRFEDFRGVTPLHCHILTHEDLGMMQLIEIG